jgi:cytochrome c-type protein NapB
VRILPAAAAAVFLLAAADREEKIAVPGEEGRVKSSAAVRAERRLYDGAPPVIPHRSFGADCVSCHRSEGVEVPGVGYSPPNPHEATRGMSAMSRCRQCHVFAETDEVFVENEFAGLRQDLRRGERFAGNSPPVIPHRVFMRENCLACHAGPAAREEVRTSHPERVRCRQCHVEQATTAEFARES